MDAPSVQYVTTSDGYSIAYTVTGSGRPFVHMPTPFNHVTLLWESVVRRPFFEQLSARFQLVCYDGRGSGMSQRGLGRSHSLDDDLRDLEAVSLAAGVKDGVLFGMFDYARVAVRYAARYPANVAGLVLWNPSYMGNASYSGRSSWDPIGVELASENWDMFIETVARTALQTEEVRFAQRLVRESNTAADWLRRWQAWSAPSEESFSEVRVPTLIIAHRAGSHAFATAEYSQEIARVIPGSRLRIFDDLGGGLFSAGPDTPPGLQEIFDFEASLRPYGPIAERRGVGSPAGLSSREVEVLRLIAAGKSNQQIADELVISLNTVQHHVSNILTKTGLASRGEAAAYAHREGLA